MDYYGIDVHKRYSVFTCLDERGQVVRRGRVANTEEELARFPPTSCVSEHE